MKHLKTLGILCLVLLFMNCENKESNKKEMAIAEKAIETITEIPEEKVYSIDLEEQKAYRIS